MNKNIKLIIIGMLLLTAIIFFGLLIASVINGGVFSNNPVSEWDTAEAIYYGCVVIALSIFFRVS